MYLEAQPKPQNRIFGATTAIGATALVAFALISTAGKGGLIAPPNKSTFTIIDAPKSEPFEDTVPDLKFDIDSDKLIPDEIPRIPPLEFAPMDDIPLPTPTEPTIVRPNPPVTTSGPVSNTRRPVLIPRAKPNYPPASIRAKEEGTTRLSVCVQANGRVQSAHVSKSSGFYRLDNAAMKWIKRARFTPGSVNGRTKTMCEHTVVYEWNLENR